MLKTTQFSAKNTKMFDLDLSDSDNESARQQKEIRNEQNKNYGIQISQQHETKQQIASKSTKSSHQNQDVKDEPKRQEDTKQKTCEIFRFREKSSEIHLKSLNQFSDTHFNDKEFEVSMEMNKRFSDKQQRDESGKVRAFSGRNNDKLWNKKQRKKIQFLNNSVLLNDVEQIHIFRQTQTQPIIRNNQQAQQMIKQKFDLQQNQEGFDCENSQKENRENKFRQSGEQIDDDKYCDNAGNRFESEEKDLEQSGSSEEQSIEQNPECIFKSGGIKFKQVVYHDFDESEQESQTQTDEQNQESLPQEQNTFDNKNQQILLKHENFTLFSSKFKSSYYISMRNKLLELLLSKNDHEQSQSQYSGCNQNIKRLLTTPVAENNMYQLQVHVYKDLFKTEFQLWVKYQSQGEEETVLIAAAYNQSFNIDKTIFVIEQVNPFNQRQFIAQLESNFSRNFYSLFAYSPNHRPHQKSSNNRSQCGNTQIQQLLNISSKIYRTVYIPNPIEFSDSLDSQEQNGNEIPAYQDTRNSGDNRRSNLAERYQKQKFRECESQNCVMKLSTSKSIEFGEDFYQQNGVRKSNKTLLIEDSSSKSEVLFIGKIASKKYKLMLGQPISLLQAFGITIAHVESS